MNKDNQIQSFREFISEEVKTSKLTAKEVKYAVQQAVEKHYSVSPIKDITVNSKKIRITGKMQFSEKFIELLIKELNDTLGTHYEKESYEVYKGFVAACGLVLVNKG